MSQLSSACVGGRMSRRPAVSNEGRLIAESMSESLRHYGLPVSRQPLVVRERFEALASKWREATRYVSSITQMVSRPEYLQIIGMGEPVLPCILRELEREPDQWAPALNAITGADPVSEEDWGDLGATARAWLHWARGQGIRW